MFQLSRELSSLKRLFESQGGVLYDLRLPRILETRLSILCKKRKAVDVRGRRCRSKKPLAKFVASSREIGELIVRVDGDNRPFAKVDIMGIPVIGLLDCGAQMTVLGFGCDKLLRDLKLKLQSTDLDHCWGIQIRGEGIR